jgi:hypothetical protein
MGALSTIRNLTGGRLPPLTRTALFSAFCVFVLALLLFAPGATPQPAAQPLTSAVRLVPAGDVRTESVILLDSSAVYIPQRAKAEGVGQGRLGQPEDAPFERPSPVLQFDPARPLSLGSGLQIPVQSIPTPGQAIPLASQDPFATFGMQPLPATAIDSRAGFYELYPQGGSKSPIINGKITHFTALNGENKTSSPHNLAFEGNFECLLTVDSLGKAPLGAVSRRTGNPELDAAIIRWAAGVSWSQKLPPGQYRLIVGP